MRRIPQFLEKHEAFIVQSIACGMGYREIVENMIRFFDDEYTLSDRKLLLLKVERFACSEKMRDYIREARAVWEKDCQDVPIAIRKIRLQRMESEYHRLEKETVEKVIVTPRNEEIIVYRQNTGLLIKLLQAAKDEMSELMQPSKDVGKVEDGLKVNMRDSRMFQQDSGDTLTEV